MARDLNKVMLIGRLGTDPEMRYTASGNPVTTFRLAVGRQWRDNAGEIHDETEWFNIVTWNRLAETCNQYLTRGARVYLEGRLQTRSWEDQQSGQTRYRTEVIASDLIMLDSRSSREPDDYPPPRETHRPQRGGAQPPPPPDIGDEDIPF
ncbi:MAG: single-stranded DNA-binding protein [Oscillochloridaceae bacterium]|nr:single-stranded DNA-binding protein [Chloroflexaceae bacterium]MDW8391161.1 single-stranded DNA-binding protein [Oscillochloridaceae bacterium]